MANCRLTLIIFVLVSVACVEWGSTAVVGSQPDVTGMEDPTEPTDAPASPSDNAAADPTSPTDDVLISFADEQCVFFVSNSQRGEGDGSSWDDATPYLQQAMSAGQANQIAGRCETILIRVGAGLFFPHPSDPSVSFPLFAGLVLKGGFLETDEDARNVDTAQTLLAGRLGDGGPQSYHVLKGTGSGIDQVNLDGITIQEGQAVGTGDDALGGGIFVEGLILSLTDVVIQNNDASERGGGLWLDGGQLVEGNVAWLDNTAEGDGGAIFARDARAYPYFAEYRNNRAQRGGSVYIQNSPDWFFQRTLFEDNSAVEGGAVYVESGESVKVCRTIFLGNDAQIGGAVKADRVETLSIASSVFTHNRANAGASLYTQDIESLGLSQLTLTENSEVDQSNIEVLGLSPWGMSNSILWRNGVEYTADQVPDLRSNLVDESVGASGTNLSGSPSFVAPYSSAPETWDLGVKADSLVIDAGDDSLIRNDFCNQDVNAQPRIQGEAVDIGAYEFSGQ